MTTMLQLLANIAVLIVGSLFLSLVYEGVAGNESFSLDFGGILLVTVVGGVLAPWYGWISTGIVLGVWGLICVVGGLADRQRERT
jgi:hypothetical protein